MYNNVQQCTLMYNNVQQCTTMYNNVQQCTTMYNNALILTAYSAVQGVTKKGDLVLGPCTSLKVSNSVPDSQLF